MSEYERKYGKYEPPKTGCEPEVLVLKAKLHELFPDLYPPVPDYKFEPWWQDRNKEPS